ncbi:MAG: ferrous iron transporter B, partial [Erysipelotrichales bacterium]|nr:ferrous iron transporter B [Erysipelotrichales bacterium]
PAITSSRIVDDNKRISIIRVIPYMICSAKLPVIMCIVSIIDNGEWLVIICYFLSILIVYTLLIFVEKNNSVDLLICEMPIYMWPDMRSVWQQSISKTIDFLSKTFYFLVVSYIIIYFGMNCNASLQYTSESSESMLYVIANYLLPIFEPIGIHDYRLVIAIICGLVAKENIVAVLMILFGGNLSVIPVSSLCSFLIFTLFYIPCIPSIAIMYKEIGLRKTMINLLIQLVIAYSCSALAYRIIY